MSFLVKGIWQNTTPIADNSFYAVNQYKQLLIEKTITDTALLLAYPRKEYVLVYMPNG